MDKQVDIELFEKAISDILSEVRPIRQQVTNATISFLDKYSISKEIQDLLILNSFDRPFKVGHIYYDKTNDIEKENLDEQNVNCINEGLLIIGCGLNGDPVVVDLQTLTVGFVFHDEIWEDSSVKARSAHIDTGLSIGQFYFNAATQIDTFPVDGYEAEEIYGQT
ncbi:MAG: hypothetical protein JST09_14435 [Bacteroidetes bacterium]|nr:hypothetical protein [Bacteroidota bacterium]